MRQYLELVRQILETGSWQDNRTGVRTIGIAGAMMRFDLQDGFPAVTTRRLAFKSAVGELVGFLRGARSAADFRALGCKVWDQNANENAQWLANPYRQGPDDLGEVYGVQWRGWPAYKVLDAARACFRALLSTLAASQQRIRACEEHELESRPRWSLSQQASKRADFYHSKPIQR